MSADPTISPSASSTPSLRRVLAAYLRLRSPYNLCIDGALIVLVSYLLGSIHRWLLISITAAPRPDQFSAMWALKEVADIAVSMVYYAGFGIFLIALARIIADRIAPSPRHD